MKYILPGILVMCFFALHAQQKETSFGVSFNTGAIMAHTRHVQNTDGSYPLGFQFEWNKQLLDEKTWENFNCYPRKGWILQYVNFDNAILGQSIMTSSYIEPYWGYGNRVSFSLKGIAGIAYLNNPYNPLTNPTNQSYSLPINGYLALGFGIHVKLSKQFNANAYGQFSHISNGGYNYPNYGINWSTISLSIDYVLKPVSSLPQRVTKVFAKKKALNKWEISPYWSNRRIVADREGRRSVVGLTVQFTKQITRINALNIGSEILYDFSLRELLRLNRINRSAWRSGLLIGHTFLIGSVSLSQQIGIYMFNPGDYFPALYQRYGLMQQLSPRFSAGINLLVHNGRVANFLDLRVIYRLK